MVLLFQRELRTTQETEALGVELYELFEWPAMVFLHGDLGAGKTTLSQAIVRAAGYTEAVTSPTYNLIHEYPLAAAGRTIFHLDLYRLNDPEELYYLGIDDLWTDTSLFLVEWPEKGKGILRDPNYSIEISKKTDQTEEIREFSVYRELRHFLTDSPVKN
jgi:tRNA threonylcarbamoyladenosine biosynthesis protein TsaE